MVIVARLTLLARLIKLVLITVVCWVGNDVTRHCKFAEIYNGNFIGFWKYMCFKVG